MKHIFAIFLTLGILSSPSFADLPNPNAQPKSTSTGGGSYTGGAAGTNGLYNNNYSSRTSQQQLEQQYQMMQTQADRMGTIMDTGKGLLGLLGSQKPWQDLALVLGGGAIDYFLKPRVSAIQKNIITRATMAGQNAGAALGNKLSGQCLDCIYGPQAGAYGATPPSGVAYNNQPVGTQANPSGTTSSGTNTNSAFRTK